jgi:hypothetical protein
LFVLGSELSQKFNAGIVEKGPLDFSRGLGTVER